MWHFLPGGGHGRKSRPGNYPWWEILRGDQRGPHGLTWHATWPGPTCQLNSPRGVGPFQVT